MKFFGKDIGFRHHTFGHYIDDGNVYFDFLVKMGEILEEKKLEETTIDTTLFSNYFFFYDREASFFYAFSDQDTEPDPYIYEYHELTHIQKYHLRFSEFMTWWVEAFDNDVRGW